MAGNRRASIIAVATLSALAPPALAGGDVGVTLGAGRDGYASTTIDAGADLGSLPLRLDASDFRSIAKGGELSQQTATLKWKTAAWLSTQAGYKHLDDNVLLMDGWDLGATVQLNKLWNSSRFTSLNLGYGRLDYEPDTDRRVPLVITTRIPQQSHRSIGLTQAVTDDLSITLSMDRYEYTSDPLALAATIAVLARRGRFPLNPAYTIAGFPDWSRNASAYWGLGNDYSLSLSYSETSTVLTQKLRGGSIGVFHAGTPMTLGVTLTRSVNGSVSTPAGLRLVPASNGTFLELRAGYAF